MQHFNVKVNDIDIHGIKIGQGEEVVIALHGWLDNCASFMPMLQNADLKQTWYCIDLPGHGFSSWRSRNAHYYFTDYIDDLHAFIVAHKFKRVHIVGHSMGAMIASLFASCFNEYVKSVTFIEGIGCITTASENVTAQLKSAIKGRARLPLKTPRVYKTKAQIYQARAKNTDLAPALIATLMARNIREDALGYRLKNDPKLKIHSGFRFDEAQCRATIKEIRVPCQLILGDKGYSFVKQNLNIYGKYYNKLTVKLAEGGHHCHMQSTVQCFKYVNSFVMQNGAC